MKRKLLAGLMALALLLPVGGCMGTSTDTNTPTKSPVAESKTDASATETQIAAKGPAADTKQLPEMNTTDQIHLTYATWDDWEMADYLAAKFTEKYPNIEVEIVKIPIDGYNDALLALASSGQLPDAYMYLSNVDMPTANGWLCDITEYWDNDPEADKFLSSIKESGRLDGERVFVVAGEYLPMCVYIDKAVFDKLNVPMPDSNWTYEEMLALMKSMTRPEEGIYGYNSFFGIISFAPVSLNDSICEFGWDGSNYKFDGAWATALNTEAEFRRLGYRAMQGTEEWGAASGDIDMWPGASGRVAMQHDAWWTMNNIYTKSEAIEKGIEMIPYVLPRGANSKTDHKLAFLDYAAISSATDYPREAYEMLKFLTWGTDGWYERIEAFKTLTNEAGDKIYEVPNCLPLIDDDALWAEYRKLYPPASYYDDFFAHAKEPIGFGGTIIPGFVKFLNEIYQNGDYNGYPNVEDAVFNGAIDANDVAADLNKKGREYYEAALETFYSIYGK